MSNMLNLSSDTMTYLSLVSITESSRSSLRHITLWQHYGNAFSTSQSSPCQRKPFQHGQDTLVPRFPIITTILRDNVASQLTFTSFDLSQSFSGSEPYY